MKTTLPKPADIQRGWVLVDAQDKPVGRLSVKIANILRGRNKPIFTPAIDTGDFVVVINAEKVKLTGRKNEQKLYADYSGFRGGLRKTPAADLRARHPEQLIQRAVKGMLPKNHLAREQIKRLKVYAGTAHPHAAQNPQQTALA